MNRKVNDNIHVPFERSYWVVLWKLLAGCYPGDINPEEARKKLNGIIGGGIRRFINLMQEDETDRNGVLFAPYEPIARSIAEEMGVAVAYERMPIHDLGVPTKELMNEILDLIDGSIAENRSVYVHCFGGIGLTGTVVGCYLVRHGVAKGRAALDKIMELRKYEPMGRVISPETKEQRRFVVGWE